VPHLAGRRIDHVLGIRVEVLIDLRSTNRCRRRASETGGLLDIRRRKIGVGVDTTDAEILLGVDVGRQVAAVGLIRGRGDALRTLENVTIRLPGLRVRRGGGRRCR